MSLIKLQHNSEFHRNIMVINWIMGDKCNYACEYCPSFLHEGEKGWVSYESAIKFIDKLIHHYVDERKKILYFDLTGGEVTLNKDLFNIANYLKERNCWLGIISNGSPGLNFWMKLKPLLGHICLSFHPVYADKDHFYKVVEYIHDTVTTHVNIIMHPDYFELCEEMGVTLAKNLNNITVSYQPLLKKLLIDSSLYEYSDIQIKKMNQLEEESQVNWTRRLKTYRGKMLMVYEDGTRRVTSTPLLLANGQNDWRGWYCWTGLEQIVVESDGTIYRAWCKQERIGNIDDEVLKFPENPVICKTEKCFCQLDLASTKHKAEFYTNEEKEVFIKSKELFNNCRWYALDDSFENGCSEARIISQSKDFTVAFLNAKRGNASFTYAIAGAKIQTSMVEETLFDGMVIDMNLDKGKIISIRLPLTTNEDFDHYEYQLLGEGEKEYVIPFHYFRQQGWGDEVSWDPRKISEIQFINECLDNPIEIKIYKIEFYKT